MIEMDTMLVSGLVAVALLLVSWGFQMKRKSTVGIAFSRSEIKLNVCLT